MRARIEHMFAAEKRGMGLLVRTVGLIRVTAEITLANLAYSLWTPPCARTILPGRRHRRREPIRPTVEHLGSRP